MAVSIGTFEKKKKKKEEIKMNKREEGGGGMGVAKQNRPLLFCLIQFVLGIAPI